MIGACLYINSGPVPNVLLQFLSKFNLFHVHISVRVEVMNSTVVSLYKLLQSFLRKAANLHIALAFLDKKEY